VNRPSPPRRPLRGTVRVPGDKSITHRAVMLAALAEGESQIAGYLPSEDCLRTVTAFQQMGISIIAEHRAAFPILRVMGKGLRGLSEPDTVIDCGNSGTTMRLLAGVLAGQPFFSTLTGDASLRRRPMHRVVAPLRQMGARIFGRAEANFAPLAIAGGALAGVDYRLPIASAQVKSALLLAGLLADGTTRISEPLRSRDHTERMFEHFGIPCERQADGIGVRGGASFKGREITVPGDFSSAAFFLVAGAIVAGSEICIAEVGVNPTRTGLLDVLRQMGADLTVLPLASQCGEPVARIAVRASRLRGVGISGAAIPTLIDEFPILCVAAAVAEGETLIRDAAELRVKESDRIATMAAALSGMGVDVDVFPDGMRIVGGRPLSGFLCQTHGDHRVAMAMAVAGQVTEGAVTLDDTACIQTSFPNFMALLDSLGPDGSICLGGRSVDFAEALGGTQEIR